MLCDCFCRGPSRSKDSVDIYVGIVAFRTMSAGEFGSAGDPTAPLEEPPTKPTLSFTHPYTQNNLKVAESRSTAPISLYYEMHGVGKKRVLLVMGVSSSCRNWDTQASVKRRKLANFL